MGGELVNDDTSSSRDLTPLQSYHVKLKILRRALASSTTADDDNNFCIKDAKLFIECIKELNKMEGHYKLDMLTENKVLVDVKYLREMAQKHRKEY